jgi:ATP-dependent helicase/nuclease subunit A
MKAGFAGLTDEQEPAAARRSEPLALAAAAGSGKTSVLVERFVRAVLEDGISPGRILAITFTERAAGELRSRVRARLLELGRRDAARDTEAAFVGTFHGFCARLLRAHPLAAELDPAFTILDEGRAGRLREQALTVAAAGFIDGGRAEAVDLLAAYKVDRVNKLILGTYAELRSRGQRRPQLPDPPVVQDDPDAPDAALARELLDELLGRFADAYEELKLLRGGVDFDDLELAAGQLLEERPLVRKAWSERFELLMVDEFQDTNPRQLAILQALEHGNLFTVGDEFQSIYGFRHADVGLFRGRRDELAGSGQSLSLTRNFRSRPALLEVVNEIFAERFPGYSPLLAGRDSDASPTGPEVELLLNSMAGWDETPELARAVSHGLGQAQLWRQAEARMMAGRIAELIASGEARAGEIVVLLRATGDLDLFERALALRGLRTLAAVGAFWGQQQVADLLAYLRALANPLDELALHSALASPLGGCSLDALALLAAAAHRRGRGLWETAQGLIAGQDGELEGLLSGGDRAALGRFCGLLGGERSRLARRTISQLIEQAIESTGYREHVLGQDWGERRIANVHKLLRLARRFEASEGRDLRAFLEQVAYLQRAAAIEPDAPVEGVEPDAVRLMTIHAAKGLEFPVVCIADMGRAPNNQMPDLLVDGARLGLRLVRLDGGDSVHALEFDALMEERKARDAEEENRILYVAMTRARDRLLLCGSAKFESWPKPTASPIAWVAPALDRALPELLAAGGEPTVLRVGPAAVEVRVLVNRPGVAEPLPPALPSLLVPSALGAEALAPEPLAPVDPAGEREPQAEPAPLMTGSLSYSSLSEFERCGYRFYLERVLRLPEDRAAGRGGEEHAGLEPRARGTLVHSLMETLDFAAGAGPSAVHVESTAAALGLAASEEEARELAALVAAAAASGPARRIAAARPIGREYPFALSLGPGETLLTGVIDLLAEEEGGGRLLVDYKSDRVEPPTDLEQLVEREYGVQRLLYALAALRSGAPRVEVVHWFLERPEEPALAIYEASALAELEERLARLARRALAGGYEVSPRPHRALCLTCPGRRSLCSWSEEETLRGGPEPELESAEQEPESPLRLF